MAKNLLSYETLVHAVAGACGSVSAMAVTIPLDTVRTRMLLDPSKRGKGSIDTILKLIQEEGVLTLYRGTMSTLQAVAASNFVYFYAFHGLKHLLGSSDQQSATKDLAFACLAGCINVVLTNPLWVVNSRIKMQHTSARTTMEKYDDGLGKMIRTEGLLSIWSGTVPSLILVSNPAIKFTAYEFLKRKVLALTRITNLSIDDALEPGQAFMLGVVASLMATIATYPVQVVQTKSRHGHSFKGLRPRANMLEITAYILRNFGMSYLYKGLEAKLLQSVIAAGFMFLSYEEIAAVIFRLLGAKRVK